MRSTKVCFYPQIVLILNWVVLFARKVMISKRLFRRSNLQSASSGIVSMQYSLSNPVQPHTHQCPNQQPALRHPRWHQSWWSANPPPLYVQRRGIPSSGPHQQRTTHSGSSTGQGSLRGTPKPWSQWSASAASAALVTTATTTASTPTAITLTTP